MEEELASPVQESLPKPTLGKPIAVVKGVHLTADEVIGAFNLNGAENIMTAPCGKLADAAVIATARSSMHAKMLAELVVRATRERRLRTLNPGRPIEGDQDWFLVDTGVLLIHIFGDQATRERLNLERHFEQQERKRQLANEASSSVKEDVIEENTDMPDQNAETELDGEKR
jgi:ribosomal silencing factor RsfS